MDVIYATVKQNIIYLPEGVPLSDGTEVEIRTRQPDQEAEAEMRFKEYLLKLGVLSHIAKPRRAIQRNYTPGVLPSSTAESDFKQALLAAGLITKVKPAVMSGWKGHKPIMMPGKPLSEIILEDPR